MPIIISPSVSPLYSNNPGYTIIDINPTIDTPPIYKVDTVMRFLQLGEYILMQQENFISFNPSAYFKMSLTDSASIKQHAKMMKSDSAEYARYIVTKMGYRPILADIASYSD